MIAVPKYVESRPPVEAAATYGTSSVQVTELLIGKLSDSGSSRSKRARLTRERGVVARVRFADQHRQQGDGRRAVAHEAHQRAQLERADLRRVGLVGRAGVEACEHLGEELRQRREPRAALRVGRAAREDLLERALRLACDVGPERERRRHDAVEHERAHALGVLAQVMLRDARAVRHAVDVPRLDAEGDTDALEVANGHGRRIEARVVVELRDAGVDDARERLGGRRVERQVVGHLAGEPFGRPARAALIDEDQVAVAPRRLERAAHLQVEVDGALPGPAADQEQRIGARLGAERSEPGDEDLDRGAVGRRRIERHGERAAAPVGRRQRVGREAAALIAAPFGLRGGRNGEGEHPGNEQRRHALAHKRRMFAHSAVFLPAV